ncbi:MAG: UvrB/UvrC motif-containing protein [Verrucomicrobiales bacterium]|jgi:protein arginine kinase activator|nr:UvrB/UvrC motif-containing protein [Verrucomicrobiales bacterium]
MKCSFCNNEASCHLTKIVNGKSVEVYVCEHCVPEINNHDLIDFDIWDAIARLAAAKGMPDPTKLVEGDESLPISAKSLMMSPQAVRQGEQRCDACGFTSEDLRKTGRLGCSECYCAFTDILAEVLSDCQKSNVHVGKIPAAMNKVHRKRLEEELNAAIAAERFEDAARLRDQIRALG